MNTYTQRDLQDFVTIAVRKMLPHLRAKLNDKFWDPRIRVSFSPRRNRSWGGIYRNSVPGISLALSRYVGLYEESNITFNEYKSFAHDREIGSVYGDIPRCVTALVAHELAHAAQWSINTKKVAGPTKYAHGGINDRGHGELWKEIYRDLRNLFVNDLKGNTMTKTVETPAVVKETPNAVKAKPVKEPKVTNRSRVNAIVEANKTKKTSEVIGLVMAELKISKPYATTYVYLARKDLGLNTKAAKAEAKAAVEKAE